MHSRISLRRVFLWVLAAAGLGLVAVAAAASALFATAQTRTVGELTFANELKIPPVLEPREEDGRKVFELRLEQGRAELLPGKPAETWGANGGYLGPTLRAHRGDRVELRVRNSLPQATTIHWHGMHLPAVADGGPHQTIEPGATWSPSWKIDQPAATLWYHPHPHRETADHVYRGLAGLFILDDPDADRLALPHEYGSDDIPLIIQDKRLHDDGSLDFSQSSISNTGRLGDTILVNGTYDPYLEIGHERVRFRLLNASNARIYNIGFADEREFDLIASDAGLLERARRVDRIQLSPGERAEIVAAFRANEEVVLRSFEPELGTNFWEERFAGGDDTLDLLELRSAETLASSPRVPARLATHERLDEKEALHTRRFELDGRSINGKKMDPGRIDQVLEPDTTEIWEVRNTSGIPHNFHPHGVSFRILDYAGDPPPPPLTGLKDTVYVPPGETVRLVVHSPHYADPDTPYMFHCHLLQHEDLGMMGQFVVLAPGQDPSDSSHEHSGS